MWLDNVHNPHGCEEIGRVIVRDREIAGGVGQYGLFTSGAAADIAGCLAIASQRLSDGSGGSLAGGNAQCATLHSLAARYGYPGGVASRALRGLSAAARL